MGFVFPEDILEKIKAVNDVYDVISEYVSLKKSGRNFRGLCPFHGEKTPSFFVNSEKQIFHCFGCGAGGNVFTFIMQYENFSFPEAVSHLAQRKGITLPAPSTRMSRENSVKDRLREVNETAALFFQQHLTSTSEGGNALSYLARRGINQEGVKKFRIGLSPSGWEGLQKHLQKKGFPDEIMVKAGLVIPRKKGSGFYDRFRNRLMFPIANPHGDIVAFGGRVLAKDDEPKYINSPETPLYHKGEILYGLHLAKSSIREAGYAVVVEGYLDAITAHMTGAGNAVATMGTALTKGQLRLLRRYSPKVVIIYDSDDAGIAATKRSLELFLDEDMTVNSAALAEGHDPDSFIRARGIEAFQEALKNSSPLMDFFIEKTAEAWRNDGIEGKVKAVDEIIPLLSRITNHVKQSEYVRTVARVVDVREDAVQAQIKSRSDPRKRSVPPSIGTPSPPRRRRAEEEELVRAMLLDTSLARKIREELSLSLFQDEICRAVASAVYKNIDNCPENGTPVIPVLENQEAAALAARLLADEGKSENLVKVVADCLDRIHRAKMARELNEVQEKIRQAEQAEQPEILNELLKIKQNIARA